MLSKILIWFTTALVFVLAVPVIFLLFLISVLWTALGRLTNWLERAKRRT